METKNNGPRIIISGGGTGGHIFPAVSIANASRNCAQMLKSSLKVQKDEWSCNACPMQDIKLSVCL